MGDHDDDAAARPNAQNGAGQGVVAVAIEIGIGLVENDQERIAVKRPGEPDPLALAR